MPLDLKKAHREFYMATNQPMIVTVPAVHYAVVRGVGESSLKNSFFKQAVMILYAVGRTLKMSYRTAHQIDGSTDAAATPTHMPMQAPSLIRLSCCCWRSGCRRRSAFCRRCSEIPNIRHSAMTIQGIARIRNVCMVYSATSFRNSASRSKLPSTNPGTSLMALQILMLMPVIMEPISSSV